MTPYYTDESVTIYHGDCRDVLPRLSACDHVITDPPYSEHTHAKSRQGARVLSREGGGSRAEFSRVKAFGFSALDPATRTFVAQWTRVHCPRWVLAFSDIESAPLWRTALCDGDGGLEYVRTGAWVKVGATPQFTGDRPAVGFEAIVICHRAGKKRWNGGGSHAVWSVPIVLNRGGADPRLHTTQKPEDLLIALVVQFTDPGELIVDPFMGSGTTLAAAKRLGRRAIGIERDEASCAQAASRLAQAALPFEPPTPRRERRERAGLLTIAEAP